MMHLKVSLRSEVLGLLKNLPDKVRDSYDTELVSLVTASDEWKNAKTIAITLSRFPEVSTQVLIESALSDGKRVVIPYSGKQRKLSFYEFDENTVLAESKFGILEPKDREAEVKKTAIDLIIVPGLAYSPKGYRVGFGGGYYDRYLSDYQGRTISILYPLQLRPDVDEMTESFDIPVHKLFIPSI